MKYINNMLIIKINVYSLKNLNKINLPSLDAGRH